MPIRFRCVYCDRLLGISRRKAGAIVTCPHCKEKLIVPSPGPEDEGAGKEAEKETNEDAALAPVGGVGPQLFERDDFERLLQPQPAFRGEAAAAPARARPASSAQVAEPLPLEPYVPQMVAPPPPTQAAPQPLPSAGIVISPARATWLSVAAVLLLAIAFGAGLLVGRFFRP